MDKLIKNSIDLIKIVIEKFYKEKTFQYSVLVGYLFIWLLSSGSFIQTIFVGLAIAMGWIIGQTSINKNEE